jgi:DNA-binding transcriptional LysR family regulator
VPSAGVDVVPRLLREYRASHPDVKLILRPETTSHQLAALAQGTIDVGIVVPPLHEARHLRLELFCERELALAVPSTHSLAARKRIQLRQLASESFVGLLVREGPGFESVVLAACQDCGFVPRFVETAAQMQVCLRWSQPVWAWRWCLMRCARWPCGMWSTSRSATAPRPSGTASGWCGTRPIPTRRWPDSRGSCAIVPARQRKLVVGRQPARVRGQRRFFDFARARKAASNANCAQGRMRAGESIASAGADQKCVACSLPRAVKQNWVPPATVRRGSVWSSVFRYRLSFVTMATNTSST